MPGFDDGYLPITFAPDPGGILARQQVGVFPVQPFDTPVQHSPLTSWSQGTPYPGPNAVVQSFVDYDSRRWWGRTGQGQLVWSQETEFSADLPSPVDPQISQHVDVWQRFVGGFPSISRLRPSSFGSQVPVLTPTYPIG